MKKIKISELPLFSSLKGLFTIGTDDQNRSVKVSLEFIENETNAAVTKANTAAEGADAAAAATRTATTNCQTATAAANTATANANTAKNNANTAAQTANEAAANAITVKLDIQDMLDRLVPTGLTVVCPSRLTLGNPKASVVAKLTPETALKNVIFLSDDKAVEIDILTGQLTPLACGKSKVRIVPTTNVALTKTILIEVGDATLRLQTKTALRLTSGGSVRLN